MIKRFFPAITFFICVILLFQIYTKNNHNYKSDRVTTIIYNYKDFYKLKSTYDDFFHSYTFSSTYADFFIASNLIVSNDTSKDKKDKIEKTISYSLESSLKLEKSHGDNFFGEDIRKNITANSIIYFACSNSDSLKSYVKNPITDRRSIYYINKSDIENFTNIKFTDNMTYSDIENIFNSMFSKDFNRFSEEYIMYR